MKEYATLSCARGLEEDAKKRAGKIKLLILDVDGVLTDGRIVYGSYGDELKFFDVHDGFGVVLVKKAGIKTVIITAKKSKVVKIKAKELKIDRLYQNASDKLKVFNKVIKKFKVTPEEVCFIGDDLLDIPVLKKVGLAACVSNAVEEVKSYSHITTTKMGGRGAVREVCELLLKSQGRWSLITRKYLH